MGLHDGHRRRKREQFLQHGLDSFAEHEVLELLLFYAISRRDTNETAHRLINTFGSLGGVFGASVEELQRVEGVGEQRGHTRYMSPQSQRSGPHGAEFWGPRTQGDSARLSMFKGSKLRPQQGSLSEPEATPDTERRQRGSESHQQPITAFLLLLLCASQIHRLETALQRERQRAGNSSSFLIREPGTRCLQNAHIPRSKTKTVVFVECGVSPIVCDVFSVKSKTRVLYKLQNTNCVMSVMLPIS